MPDRNTFAGPGGRRYSRAATHHTSTDGVARGGAGGERWPNPTVAAAAAGTGQRLSLSSGSRTIRDALVVHLISDVFGGGRVTTP
jgi:hypothetical protein